MAYLLDANVFMTAKNSYYGLDFCPAFWEWLIRANADQRVFSIQKVGDELKAGSDPLAEWVAHRGPGFFVEPDSSVLSAFGTVSTWAQGQGYKQGAISTFLQGADYYLVAHALAHAHTVVCLEVPSGTKKIIKIPDACISLGVKCVMTYEMLRTERARFVLG